MVRVCLGELPSLPSNPWISREKLLKIPSRNTNFWQEIGKIRADAAVCEGDLGLLGRSCDSHPSHDCRIGKTLEFGLGKDTLCSAESPWEGWASARAKFQGIGLSLSSEWNPDQAEAFQVTVPAEQ